MFGCWRLIPKCCQIGKCRAASRLPRPTRNVALKPTTETCDSCCCNKKKKRIARKFASMKAASGPPVFTEQVLLLRVVTAETFFVQQHHVATIREKKTVGLPKIQPTASDYDDMVRKRRHRHRNDHQTYVNILVRKAFLGGATDTNSENQRVRDFHWSLMVRYLFAHWMVPRSSIPSSSKQNSAILMTVQEQIDTPTERKRGATRHGRRSHKTSHPKTNCVRNLLQRGRSETSKQRRCIADTAASLRSMTAGVKCCISDHFAKPRSCTVGQRNCIAKRTAMLSSRKKCSMSTILCLRRVHPLEHGVV